MFKKVLLLFFVFIIYILLYCHIRNCFIFKINIKNPIIVHEPHFELKFEKVPLGIKTIFDDPDVMRNVNITKLSIYYTVWKYARIVSDDNKMRSSLIGLLDSHGNNLPPNIYHALMILEESDDSEFIYIIELCSFTGVITSKVLRSSRKSKT